MTRCGWRLARQEAEPHRRRLGLRLVGCDVAELRFCMSRNIIGHFFGPAGCFRQEVEENEPEESQTVNNSHEGSEGEQEVDEAHQCQGPTCHLVLLKTRLGSWHSFDIDYMVYLNPFNNLSLCSF